MRDSEATRAPLATALPGGLSREQRLLVERVILAVVLPAVAGHVNGTGFFRLGVYTSHSTGNLTRFGLELGQLRGAVALGAAWLVLLFFCGALASTLMVGVARRLQRARYIGPLLAEMACLSAFAVVSQLLTPTPAGKLALAGLLALAMGLQNAMVTKISGAVVRTTHLTGIVTDSAIEVGHLMAAAADGRPWAHMWQTLPAHPAARRLLLHVSIVMSFVCGAMGGSYLDGRFGPVALVAPCGVLACLALVDLGLGLGGHPPRHLVGAQDGSAARP